MIENKDKSLIKNFKGLISGKNDILKLLEEAQTDRERIYAIFLMTVGCEKVLGLDPNVMFDKLLKYKNVEDVNNIIKKEYEKSLKSSMDKITDVFKEFIEKMSPNMIKEMNHELDERNRLFVSENSDKFVLVRSSTESDNGIEFYTTDDSDGSSFDMDIAFSKTFDSFDDANKYRNDNKLEETKIYSVEDCGSLIK